MGIRLPLKTVLSYNDAANVGAGSVAGGVAKTFVMPQDADTVVVKLTASIIGGGVSAVLQTTDDGGTTWFDVARTSIVSNGAIPTWCGANTYVGTATGINAFPANSILSVGIANTAASTVGVNQVSGLPLLGTYNRVFLRYTAAVSGNDLSRVEVKVNSESQNG